MASLTEESHNKLSKQELIAMMLKCKIKLDLQIRSLLNESFQQFKSDLDITKSFYISLYIYIYISFYYRFTINEPATTSSKVKNQNIK